MDALSPPPPTHTPFPPQVLGAQQHQVRGHHHRDAARLLPEEAPQRHAGLRLHPAGDRSPERVRRRGPGHQQVSRGGGQTVGPDLQELLLSGVSRICLPGATR